MLAIVYDLKTFTPLVVGSPTSSPIVLASDVELAVSLLTSTNPILATLPLAITGIGTAIAVLSFAGIIFHVSTSSCDCPNGYIWNGTMCVPQQCPRGQYRNANGECVNDPSSIPTPPDGQRIRPNQSIGISISGYEARGPNGIHVPIGQLPDTRYGTYYIPPYQNQMQRTGNGQSWDVFSTSGNESDATIHITNPVSTYMPSSDPRFGDYRYSLVSTLVTSTGRVLTSIPLFSYETEFQFNTWIARASVFCFEYNDGSDNWAKLYCSDISSPPTPMPSPLPPNDCVEEVGKVSVAIFNNSVLSFQITQSLPVCTKAPNPLEKLFVDAVSTVQSGLTLGWVKYSTTGTGVSCSTC
ncbi:hypothetical protein MMARV_C020P5 [viral metagenome]|uniref:DUF5874 domain-containing protein n=1 Tax=viral metagenome TaxID=1070528 RepID=A0A6L2ZKZ8_9ZZZZ